MKNLIFVTMSVVLSVIISGCVPGIIHVGNNIVQVEMPMVELKEPTICAYVFVETSGMPRPPLVNSDSPDVLVKVTVSPPPTEESTLSIYNIVVESENVLTNLTINLPGGVEKIKRGQDLDEVFSLTLSGSGTTLTIKPRTWLETPIEGVTPPENIKKISGVVARVVTSSVPTDRGEYRFVKQESVVWKFPILVLKANPAKRILLNKIEIEIKAEKFLWLGPGDLFPSPVVETPVKLDPNLSFWVTLNNAILKNEVEIYAAPGIEPPEIPGVDDIQVGLNALEFVFNGTQYSIYNAQAPKEDPEKWSKIYTWGGLRNER
ncbi:hypothetical protein L6252_00665 [Candidatus Parcubacteria bacterium]|nr:hypothetical protein [Candidatus Parcubacteria bacterium]